MTKIHYKRDSSNVITQILAEITNILTIKDSCAPIIIYPDILKLNPEGNHEPLYACDKSVITFGTRKNIIGLCNISHVESRYIYSIVITNNSIKFIKNKALVSNTMNILLIHILN